MTSQNAATLADHGLWGVPCIKCKDVVVWGQDKIWMIENVLREHNAAK